MEGVKTVATEGKKNKKQGEAKKNACDETFVSFSVITI